MSGKVLVVGGTGRVGQALVRELVEAVERVRVGTRHPEQAQVPAGVETVRFNFHDASTFAPALEEVDRVFVLAPTGQLEPDKLLIPFLEEATRGGERKVVLMTALGVELSDDIPLRKVERFLERSGAPFVILRPNWFMDNFHTYWGEPIRQAGVIPVPAADSRSAFIDTRDVAAAAAAALRTNRFDRDAFTLTGPESLSYADAAATLSRAAGREIRYTPMDDAAFRASLIQAGVPAGYANELTTMYGPVREGYSAAATHDVEALTGHAPRPLAQYARDHADAWKA